MTTGKTASKGTAQAQRFRELAKKLGADGPARNFDSVVKKLAKAGPLDRKPIKPRRPPKD